MKKNIYIFILFLLVTTNFYGQENLKKSREKIRSAKISFISNEISLTPEQAEKFWPIYNDIKDEMYALYKEKCDIEKHIDYTKITEKEAKILVEKIQHKEEEINKKKKDYIQKLSKIIDYKQMLKLKCAEHKFKKNLLERIKKEN